MKASTVEVAEFFGVTRQTVNEWARNGCPKQARGSFDLKAVFTWWLETIYSDKCLQDDEALAAAKKRYWSAKATREELRVKEEEQRLIDSDSVYTGWARRMLEFKNGCFNLVWSLPPLLEGKDQAQMRKMSGYKIELD